CAAVEPHTEALSGGDARAPGTWRGLCGLSAGNLRDPQLRAAGRRRSRRTGDGRTLQAAQPAMGGDARRRGLWRGGRAVRQGVSARPGRRTCPPDRGPAGAHQGDVLLLVEEDHALITGDIVQNRSVTNLTGANSTIANWVQAIEMAGATGATL